MNANFPSKALGNLTQGESPSKYDVVSESIDVRADTDGGYEFSRQRFTRKPRDTVKTGFIQISHSDYLVLKAFWDDHLTSTAFTYYDYMHSIYRQVRFQKPPEWKPEAIGTRRLWSPMFEMKEI